MAFLISTNAHRVGKNDHAGTRKFCPRNIYTNERVNLDTVGPLQGGAWTHGLDADEKVRDFRHVIYKLLDSFEREDIFAFIDRL
jgi:hypothetical protein